MQLVKEDAKLTHVKSLGAVQQGHHPRSAPPQKVASNFHNQPTTLGGAGPRFEAKLETVTAKSVSPKKKDHIVKGFE